MPGESPQKTKPAAYHRILLKLSGEALMGEDAFGINREVLARVTGEIRDVMATGVQLALVVGVAISFAACRSVHRTWIVHRPTTWACSRPS